jgi:SapC
MAKKPTPKAEEKQPAAQNEPVQGLPIFFNDLVPLSSVEHATWKARRMETAPFLANQHAVPLTVDEFSLAHRFYPIVFSLGDQPTPLALMALNQDMNTFVDAEGKPLDDVYIPAYVRRYPFLLAKLHAEAEELSLCFDPSADVLGDFAEGDALFENGEATETVQSILKFCEDFETAGARTAAFVQELQEHKLLMEGELTIQPEGGDQPFVYRGFNMVNEEALRELRGDVLRKMMQSGLLPLVHAHLFSLALASNVFGRQVAQGKTDPTKPQTA